MSLLQKWLDGLRSGRYVQVRHYLRTREGYCADGVLCDVSGLGAWTETTGEVLRYGIPDWDFATRVLPTPVLRALEKEGVRRIIPHECLTPEQVDRVQLIGMTLDTFMLNDAGFTFAKIADLLEKANPEIVNQD